MQTAKAASRCNSATHPPLRLIGDLPRPAPATLSVARQLLWLTVPLVLIAAGFAALSVDWPLARWCVDKNCPAWLENLFYTLEPFGNGLGVAIIGITIFCLDPGRRWALPRVLGCAYSAGLAANGLKLLVERARPHSFNFRGGVWSTFGDWFPMLSAGSTGQSFPSGHTATAAALAAALVWLYPRGWCLFPAMAVLVGCQRIQSGAHFLSDVLCGAALGSFIALAFLKIGKLPQWLDYFESRLKRSENRYSERSEESRIWIGD